MADDFQPKTPTSPLRKLLTAGVIAAVVIAALIYGFSYYNYSQNHTSTDDAQITGNLVNVSPIISGTLNSLTVDQGSVVTKGQLIGRLEDSGPKASVAQASAAYQSALSQLPQAEQNLAYQQQATAANIQKAQAELAAQQAKTTGAQQQVTLSRNQVANQVARLRARLPKPRRRPPSTPPRCRPPGRRLQPSFRTFRPLSGPPTPPTPRFAAHRPPTRRTGPTRAATQSLSSRPP